MASRGISTRAAPHPSCYRSRDRREEPGRAPAEKPRGKADSPRRSPEQGPRTPLTKGAFCAALRVFEKWPHSGRKVRRPEYARAGKHKGFTSNVRNSCSRGWQNPIPRGKWGMPGGALRIPTQPRGEVGPCLRRGPHRRRLYSWAKGSGEGLLRYLSARR